MKNWLNAALGLLAVFAGSYLLGFWLKLLWRCFLFGWNIP